MDNNSYLSIRKLNSVLNSVQNTAILKLLASTIQIHVYATFIIAMCGCLWKKTALEKRLDMPQIGHIYFNIFCTNRTWV